MAGAPHRFIFVVLLVLVARGARAQQVGVVSFPNSGAAAAQASFLYGLAQLHNLIHSYDDPEHARLGLPRRARIQASPRLHEKEKMAWFRVFRDFRVFRGDLF